MNIRKMFLYIYSQQIFLHTYIYKYIYIKRNLQRIKNSVEILVAFCSKNTRGKHNGDVTKKKKNARGLFRKTGSFLSLSLSLLKRARISTRENIDRPEPRRAKSGKKIGSFPEKKERKHQRTGLRVRLAWPHFRRERV